MIEHEGPLYTFAETPREAYDKIVAHFSKPGAHLGQSENDRLTCAYRTSEGYACAVGCLIPDDQYHPAMDNPDSYGWDVGSTEVADLVESGMLATDRVLLIRFLSAAQKVHDGSNSVKEFVCSMLTLWDEHRKEWE